MNSIIVAHDCSSAMALACWLPPRGLLDPVRPSTGSTVKRDCPVLPTDSLWVEEGR
jgi:hypothetical protein